MRKNLPLFARFRLMIARVMEQGGDMPPFGGPADPYARVRVPRPGGTPARDASVALVEPDEEPELTAVAGRLKLP